jgi:hypothetical protein
MLSYNGYRLTPAPLVNYRKSFSRAGDETKLGVNYTIVLNGSLIAWRGSPNSSGVFSTVGGADLADENIAQVSRLASTSRKQEALRSLFSQDGKLFQYQSPDNTSTPVSCYPVIRGDINFAEGIWTDRSDYTIELGVNDFIDSPFSAENDVAFSEKIASATDTWEVNPGDTPYTYSLSHNTNAVGQTYYLSGVRPSSAWEYARSFVNNQLGLGYNTNPGLGLIAGSSVFANSTLNLTGLNPYNYSRTENIDELGGSYGVNETWILASGNAVENYTANVTNAFEGSNFTQSVSIQGQIKGLYVNLNDYVTRFTNAKLYYDNYVAGQLFTRASGLISSGINLNNLPSVSNIDYDPTNGTVNYNTSYDNRSTGTSGTRMELSVVRTQSLEDYIITVKVDGNIIGRSFSDPTTKLATAQYAFDQLVAASGFYNYATQYSKVSGLMPTPADASQSEDIINGSINFSFTYTNRPLDSVIEQYEVSKSFDRGDGVTKVSVNGNIIGLATNIYSVGVSGSDIQAVKYANASGYYASISPLIPMRAIMYGSPLVNTGVYVSISEGRNPIGGTVSYNYSYDSTAPPIFSGALSEIITMTNNGGGDTYAVIPIPGRSSGPITQNISTPTQRSVTISIELVVPIGTGGYSSLYAAKPNPAPILLFTPSGLRPIGTYALDPTESFSIQNGRYTYSQTFPYSG